MDDNDKVSFDVDRPQLSYPACMQDMMAAAVAFGKQDMVRTDSFARLEFDRQIRHALSYFHKALKFTQSTLSSRYRSRNLDYGECNGVLCGREQVANERQCE